MDQATGRRAVRKQHTRHAIRESAMGLFLEHGFESVTTTQVADAAGVAPATVFNYFETKEDIYFGRIGPLERALVELVDGCPAGQSLWTRLQNHVLFELTAGRAQHDPVAVAPFHRQIAISASLQAHEHDMFDQREELLSLTLTRALDGDVDPLRPRLVAALYVAAERFVVTELRGQLTRVDAATALREIEPFIDQVFSALADGIGPLLAPVRTSI